MVQLGFTNTLGHKGSRGSTEFIQPIPVGGFCTATTNSCTPLEHLYRCCARLGVLPGTAWYTKGSSRSLSRGRGGSHEQHRNEGGGRPHGPRPRGRVLGPLGRRARGAQDRDPGRAPQGARPEAGSPELTLGRAARGDRARTRRRARARGREEANP